MPSTADSQHRFVDAILRLPGAQNPESRDRYVAAVSSLLGIVPDFERSASATEDVTRLVAWCASQPDGLSKLVQAVVSVEDDSDAAKRLHGVRSFVRPNDFLQPDERARIEEALLTRIDHASLVAMVRDIATRWGPRLRPDTRDPQALLRLLEDSIPGADEPHPLYTFLSRLADRLRGSPYDLGDLVSEIGYRTSGEPVVMSNPAWTHDPGHYHFVVRLAEDGLASSRYLLHIWLIDDHGTWDLRYTSNTPHLLSEVHAKVDEQLADLAEDEAVDIGGLSIEFILPRALLDHDVDQWVVTAPGVSDAIGVHYPVVVRDLARMRNRIIRDRWRRRCRRLNGHDRTTAAGVVRFEHLGGNDPDIFAELMQNPELPVCLVVLGPSAAHVASRIGGWLSAGIPVVVWCRHDELSARFDAHLPGVLISGGVGSLAAAVWRLRQDSGGVDSEQQHVGKHITLLWDDANRIPPDERGRLRQPAPHS